MSIILHYKDLKLGKLEFQNNKYYYTSFEEEKKALSSYCGLVSYNLINSENRKSDVLFDFFKENFIDNILKREDILKKIDIKGLNYYEILEKFCKLNFDKFNFWLSNE